jgi:hypothetical protein
MDYQIDIRKFKSFTPYKENFLSHLPKNYQDTSMLDSCWNWERASVDPHGYGITCYGRKAYRAHRMSYIIFKGPIKFNQIVRHTCDNPRCVNPKHLVSGTQYDNMIDSVKRNRQGHQKLNEECVKVIKWMLKYHYYPGLIRKLAALHNVSSKNIINIKAERIWSWVKL